VQKWEYLQVYVDDDEFAVTSADGAYLTEVDFRSLDPDGKMKDEKQSLWKAGMGRTRFKLKLLTRLGSEGWEAVGNINTGQYYDIFILMKRPTHD